MSMSIKSEHTKSIIGARPKPIWFNLSPIPAKMPLANLSSPSQILHQHSYSFFHYTIHTWCCIMFNHTIAYWILQLIHIQTWQWHMKIIWVIRSTGVWKMPLCIFWWIVRLTFIYSAKQFLYIWLHILFSVRKGS